MPASLNTTFREFLDAIRVPAYLFDPESRHFVAANSTFCELVGYPEPELIKLEWPLIMANQGEVVRASQEIAGRQEDVFVANNFGFRRKDGTRVNTHIRYRLMRLVEGGATRQVYFAAVFSPPGTSDIEPEAPSLSGT
ncbi:MAG TPA: PAS domain S-box protein [Terriglobales bacterium]|nr:PAS domain S-box protein [Terriglobales bacterium]